MKRMFSLWVIVFFLCMSIVYAQDTGDTGFYDTGDTGIVLESEEIEALTSEEIPDYLDSIEDITLLNPYELDKYIKATYRSSLSVEDAVPGAQLTSDGYLTNGEFGQRVNLNDIPPQALVALESDGSITIYPKENDEALDYDLLVAESVEGAPPIIIISADKDYVFADGTVLHEDSIFTLVQEGVFTVEGSAKYHGIEIIESRGPVLVIDVQEKEPTNEDIVALLQQINAPHTGLVILGSDTIHMADDAIIIVQENERYKVGSKQGLILSSKVRGAIAYDVSEEIPTLHMYGSSTVFNGLRVFEVDTDAHFYSFRGGGREANYNSRLEEVYGYRPRSPLTMNIFVYSSPEEFETPKEVYNLRSGELYSSLSSQDLYVGNYLLDESFDQIPKRKAVLLWTSRGADPSIGGDRNMFKSVVNTKKQQLLAQGYAEEDIDVVEFRTDKEFSDLIVNKLEGDYTFAEVVAHGDVGAYDGGLILTQQYYEGWKVPEEEQNRYPITSTEIKNILEQRATLADAGKAEPFFAQEGAVCVISTCHSAATYSYYDPDKGIVPVQGPSTRASPIAQAVKEAAGEHVRVYGTIGPLYLVGNKQKDGTWARMFIPVADVTEVFEGTEHPTAAQIYSQNIEYVEIPESTEEPQDDS